MQLISIKSQFINWWQRLKESWEPYLEEMRIIKEHQPASQELINAAQREWQAAQNYFNNVTEPELVDHASYLLQAAERKYMYLLKKYRGNEGGS